MKAGLTLEELAAKLEADKARQQDYVVDTRELKVLTSGDGTEVKLPGVAELEPTRHFIRQLGTDLGLRADLVDRLRHTHPVQFDHLVNGLLERWEHDHDGKPGKRMIRTYTDGGGKDKSQGVARAALSDRYRRIDNYDLAQKVLPIIAKIPGVQVPVCEVTETRMYIKVLAPNGQVNLHDLIEPGKHQFLDKSNPDYVQPGFVLSNSEVGNGAMNIDRMIFRLLCLNGLITETLLRRAHVGSQVKAEDDLSIYRDETLAADDKALMMKVEDQVQAAVDDVKFRQVAAQFAGTQFSAKIELPVEAMKVLAPTVGLTDGESNSVLQHLLAGGDLSQFGAINAITRAAHDVESFDRAVELEQLAASKVMRMPEKDWAKVATAA